MVTLIVGNEGCGKTKQLIDMAQSAVSKTEGNVVVIEKGSKLTYDLTHKVRLIDIEQYNIVGYDSFLGFISGICAGNYDVTDILIDSTLEICSDDNSKLSKFLKSVNKLSQNSNTNFAISLSLDKSELPIDMDTDINVL